MLFDCVIRPNPVNKSVTLLRWNSPVVFNGSELAIKSVVCVAVGSVKDFKPAKVCFSNFCAKAGDIVNTCQ